MRLLRMVRTRYLQLRFSLLMLTRRFSNLDVKNWFKGTVYRIYMGVHKTVSSLGITRIPELIVFGPPWPLTYSCKIGNQTDNTKCFHTHYEFCQNYILFTLLITGSKYIVISSHCFITIVANFTLLFFMNYLSKVCVVRAPLGVIPSPSILLLFCLNIFLHCI